MPRPIEYYDLIFHVVRYLIKRQTEDRPTTLWQLSKRMGYGIEHIQGTLEIEHVEYVLISHGEELDYKTTEILLKHIPQSLIVQLNISDQKIKEALISDLDGETDLPELDIERRELIDPNSFYRIGDRAFEVLRPYLLESSELSKKLVRKGYPKLFVTDKLIPEKLYLDLGPVWRPYYHNRQIYFLKKCLKHAKDIAPYYTGGDSISKIKTKKYKRKKTKPQNPFLFSINSIR